MSFSDWAQYNLYSLARQERGGSADIFHHFFSCCPPTGASTLRHERGFRCAAPTLLLNLVLGFAFGVEVAAVDIVDDGGGEVFYL